MSSSIRRKPDGLALPLTGGGGGGGGGGGDVPPPPPPATLPTKLAMLIDPKPVV
jgi:hypothetical protein